MSNFRFSQSKPSLVRHIYIAAGILLAAGLIAGCSTTSGSGNGAATSTSAMASASTPPRSGFFPPLMYPVGEKRPYWSAGLGNRRLESVKEVRRLPDGSCIYTITSESQTPLYVWDRISPQYNSPAVASQYSNFLSYATLDVDNLAFLENIHRQLLKVLPEPRSKEHSRLIRKLSDAIHDARRSKDGR